MLKTKVTEEKVKSICEITPLKDRIRLAVSRFNITTGGSPNHQATGNENFNTNWYFNQSNSQTNPQASKEELGANMSTMLQTALQGTNCFNVLLNLDNKVDLDREIEFGQTGSASKKTALKKGNMQSAQVVVTGEVTEFNNQASGQTFGPVKLGKQKVRLGFVVTLSNPETREVYVSKSFNVEGNSSSKLSVGLGIPTMFGNQRLDFSGGNKYTPAVANALEKGIIEAAEWISSQKDLLIASEVKVGTSSSANNCNLVINNCDYEKSQIVKSILEANNKIKNLEVNFDNEVVTFNMDYDGSASKLLEDIMKSSLGRQLKVQSQKANDISLLFK